MKNNFNNLLKYIYDYSGKEQCRDTVNDLFRSVLEPLVQNQKIETCIFMKFLDKQDKETSIKRAVMSGFTIYNFGSSLDEFKIPDSQYKNIWENTEFLVVISGRYSAALIWDYTTSVFKNYTKVCLLYNSSIITEIIKNISENAVDSVKEKIKEILTKYSPDRRENSIMNRSIQAIAARLNDKNEDSMLFQSTQSSYKEEENDLQTAKVIAHKAKFTAHEIINNLSIINLYIKIADKSFERLEDNKEAAASIQHSLNNIRNASENISYLISDLRCMSLSRKAKYNLNMTVKAAVDLCRQKIEASGAKIKEFKADEVLVNIDKVKVHCSIINIIFNALDAGAKNISVKADENSIIISNDGREIPEGIRSKIFEEDFTTKKNGSGLGLPFCRYNMRLSGGDIRLVSSFPFETVFEIKI